MKLFHLSDLHLGRRLCERSLLEDQAYILSEVVRMVDEEAPDALIVAGDVYDKAVPPAEAVTLFDDFIWELARRKVCVLVVSGNHDSAERLSFGSRIMRDARVYVSRSYAADLMPVTLEDEYGQVRFHLLPFVKPVHVRHALEDDYPDEAAAIEDYTDAVRAAVSHMGVDERERNVLVAHQFVVGAERSESEDLSVGTLDAVDGSVLAPFDYVALGHIHRPQKVGRECVRYSGTPLKYSFSEATHRKSLSVVTLEEKGEVRVETRALTPLHDVRELRGTYEGLIDRRSWEGTATDDYLSVTLTDERDVPYAMERLRSVYPNLLRLTYDNTRTRGDADIEADEAATSLSPIELFERFYVLQNNQAMDEGQRALVQDAIGRVWEGAS